MIHRSRPILAVIAAGSVALAGAQVARVVAWATWPQQGPPSTARLSVRSAELLGVATFQTGATFGGTTIGGLSGITYDAESHTYLAVSDDRSSVNAARMYRLTVDVSDGRLEQGDVSFTEVVTLTDEVGDPFAAGSIDPEGIAVWSRGSLFVSSEGDRTRGINTSLSEFNFSGRLIDTLSVPDAFLAVEAGAGIRNNLALESLAIAPASDWLVTGVEAPLLQDGAPPTLESAAWVRLVEFDLDRWEPTHQLAYRVEPIPFPPSSPSNPAENGLVDLVALDDVGTLLALERSYAAGRGNTIRLFETRTRGSVDVASVQALPAARPPTDPPMAKRLIVDLADLGLRPDNIEGMALGPDLADGRRLLVLVSDNNFSPLQTTQVVGIELELDAHPAIAPAGQTLPVSSDQTLGPPAFWSGSGTEDMRLIAPRQHQGISLLDATGGPLAAIPGDVQHVAAVPDFFDGDANLALAISAGSDGSLRLYRASREPPDFHGRSLPLRPFSGTVSGLQAFTALGSTYVLASESGTSEVARLKVTVGVGRDLGLELEAKKSLAIPAAESPILALAVDGPSRAFALLAGGGILDFDPSFQPPDGAAPSHLYSPEVTGSSPGGIAFVEHPRVGQVLLVTQPDEGLIRVLDATGRRGNLGSFALTGAGAEGANRPHAIAATTAGESGMGDGFVAIVDAIDEPQVVVESGGRLRNLAWNTKVGEWPVGHLPTGEPSPTPSGEPSATPGPTDSAYRVYLPSLSPRPRLRGSVLDTPRGPGIMRMESVHRSPSKAAGDRVSMGRSRTDQSPGGLRIADQFGGYANDHVQAPDGTIHLGQGRRVVSVRWVSGKLEIVGRSEILPGVVTDIALAGESLVALDSTGTLTLLQLSAGEPQVVHQLALPGDPRRLAATADAVLVSTNLDEGPTGLVFSKSDRLVQLERLTLPADDTALTAAKSTFIAAMGNDLFFIRPLGPGSETWSIAPGCPAQALAAHDDALLLGCPTSVLGLDLRLLRQPEQLFTMTDLPLRGVYHLAVHGQSGLAAERGPALEPALDVLIQPPVERGLIATLDLRAPQPGLGAAVIRGLVGGSLSVSDMASVILEPARDLIVITDTLDVLGTNYPLPGPARSVATTGNHLVTGSSWRLQIFSAENLELPAMSPALEIRSSDLVFAERDHLFVSAERFLATAVLRPSADGGYEDAGIVPVSALDVASHGDLVYVAGPRGLQVLRYGDPGTGPFQVAPPLSDLSAWGVEAVETGAWVAAGTRGICHVAVDFPALPAVDVCLPLVQNARLLEKVGELYLTADDTSLRLLDLGPPPKEVSRLQVPLADRPAVAVSGDRLYALGRSSVLVVEHAPSLRLVDELQVPVSTASSEVVTGDSPRDVAADGGRVYVAAGEAGVYLLHDAAVPTAPIPSASATATSTPTVSATAPGASPTGRRTGSPVGTGTESATGTPGPSKTPGGRTSLTPTRSASETGQPAFRILLPAAFS